MRLPRTQMFLGLATLTMMCMISATSLAQTRSIATAPSIQQLTSSLLELSDEYDNVAPGSRIALIHQMRTVAMQRQRQLLKLLEQAPSQVIQLALPDAVVTALPDGVQALVEHHVSLKGELEVSIEDGQNYSRIHYGLRIGDKRVALAFAYNPPGNLLTGMILNVEGVQVGEALATTSTATNTSTTSTSTSVLPNTFGAQKTLVMLVNFQDNTTQPYTVQNASDVVFGQASNFWLENSFQQTWVTGDVAGWFTLPITAGTTCPTSSIQTYAQQAAQSAGYVLSNYNHFVYVFPQLTGCSWAGYSYIGGNPSNSWINGQLTQNAVSHELGHALGLYHSHGLEAVS